MTDVADQVARAEAAMGLLPDGAGGESELVHGIPCASYPIAEPWASQAKALLPPPPSALDAAIEWLTARSPGWTVMTRARFASLPVFTERALEPWLELPVLVLANSATLRKLGTVGGLSIGPPASVEEFLAVYGSELAPLVTPATLEHPDYDHLVARRDGAPVACARIRRVRDTAYIGAITVLPAERGRGFGLAISAAAARLAASSRPSVVWMSARAELHPLYARVGFRHVDTHLLLARG